MPKTRVDSDRRRGINLLILDAVDECGRINGWANKSGRTTTKRWEDKVRADGVFSPPWLNPWVRGKDRRTPEPKSLMNLAKIMAHYGVKVNGRPMPEDYFLTALEALPPSPASVRELLVQVPEDDQLEILSWLAAHLNRAKKKALSNADKPLAEDPTTCPQ